MLTKNTNTLQTKYFHPSWQNMSLLSRFLRTLEKQFKSVEFSIWCLNPKKWTNRRKLKELVRADIKNGLRLSLVGLISQRKKIHGLQAKFIQQCLTDLVKLLVRTRYSLKPKTVVVLPEHVVIVAWAVILAPPI